MQYTKGQLPLNRRRQMTQVPTTCLKSFFRSTGLLQHTEYFSRLTPIFQMKQNVFICLWKHTLSLQAFSRCNDMIILGRTVVQPATRVGRPKLATFGTNSLGAVNRNGRRQTHSSKIQKWLIAALYSVILLFFRCQSQHLLGPALMDPKHQIPCLTIT